MSRIHLLRIIEETTADGPGFRTSVYCSGCAHKCPGCHNPSSWCMTGGEETEVEDIFKVIEADEFADVTFSGGDPLYQAKAFTELARMIKERTDKTIWCYTGFVYEDISDPDMKELLKYIDVLVDGPFVMEKKVPGLRFKGSANQRIIHLKDGKIDFIEE